MEIEPDLAGASRGLLTVEHAVGTSGTDGSGADGRTGGEDRIEEATPSGSVATPPGEAEAFTESETPEGCVDSVDHVLDEVEEALDRLDDGSYGQCESCGVPIDDTRLAGEPVARECAGCASQRDD